MIAVLRVSLVLLAVLFGPSATALAAEATVGAPWARATAGRAETGAAYLTLKGGDSADSLVAAASPVAATVELHTHLEEDGVMRMRPVASIPVGSGEKVELKPGGLHIMLIGLKGPLKEGKRFPLTLTFQRAGTVEVEVPILAPGARDGG